MDTVIMVEGDPNGITLNCEKQKESGKFPQMHFKATNSNDSLVVSPYSPAGGSSTTKERVIEFLEVNPDKRNGEIAKALSVNASTVSRALSALIAEGLVTQDATGSLFRVVPRGEISS
jgi:predicted HTH transcriptional regulator